MHIKDMDAGQASFYSQLPDRDLREAGVCIAEGRTIVDRLLASDWEVLSVLCTPEHQEEYQEHAAGRFPVFSGRRRDLGELLGYKFHRGLIAAARRPQLRTWEAPPGGRPGWGFYLGAVQESSNIGSIIRSAVAFGADYLLLAAGNSSGDPFSRKAIRSSVGLVLQAPLYEIREESLPKFAAQGRLELAAADTGKDSIGFPQFLNLLLEKKASGEAMDLLLSLGHEFAGHEDEVISGANYRVRIPMAPGVDSLNVASSAAILAYALSDVFGSLPAST